MGGPRKLEKKFETPMHPWREIEEEKEIMEEYALKKKKELWKMDSILKNFKDQAKNLIALRGDQAEKERTQLMERLQKLNLISKRAELDEILSLERTDILDRRLQSIVYERGLARSMNQARQFIVHKHIKVDGSIVTSPSYLVEKSEEESISFDDNSPFSDPDHPERPGNEPTMEELEETAERTEEVKKEKAEEEIKSEEEDDENEEETEDEEDSEDTESEEENDEETADEEDEDLEEENDNEQEDDDEDLEEEENGES